MPIDTLPSWTPWVLAVLVGYLLGSIPFGLVLTRAAGLGDIRGIGSGNIGATNVLRTGRRDLAAATLLLDAGKAGLAFLFCWQAALHVLPLDADRDASLAEALRSSHAYSLGLVAGASAFIGHCYPVWLGFKGGKGVATFIGLLLFANWIVGLAFGAIWLATAGLLRMSSFAALVATAATPVIAWLLRPNGDLWIVSGALAVLIFWRHRANIARILAGTEPKIGAKKKEADAAASPSDPPA